MEKQYKEESSDDQGNSDKSCKDDNCSSNQDEECKQYPISPDALIVQIIARLDGPLYSQALSQDAKVRSIALAPTRVLSYMQTDEPTLSHPASNNEVHQRKFSRPSQFSLALNGTPATEIG